ncbi:alpha/beta-hydrolase [Panus rudis PR-1116 ss-1]|nr:alpha/beta-hydrolase [Panus rudis PR-1116 ss-1]
MVFELKNEPYRSLFITYKIVTLYLFRLPFWSIYYIPKALRPYPTWTWRRCIQFRKLKVVFDFGEVSKRAGPVIAKPDYRAILAGLAVKGLWLEPVSDLVVGDVKSWADTAGVESIRIPGYWYDREGSDTPIGEKPKPGEKVVYFIHGGGFVVESASPKGGWVYLIQRLTTIHPSIRRALAVEYRLTTGPPSYELQAPFPAALIDSLAGYNYLANTVGFDPNDIIVAGDSAGGNLTITLTKYLVENSNTPAVVKSIPAPPGAIIPMCPWADLGSSHEGPGASLYKNESTDIIGEIDTDILFYARKNYAGVLGMNQLNSNRYISPASTDPSIGEVSFKGFPRTFIQGGNIEIFIDQIRTLRDKMREELGKDLVEYYEVDGGVHDCMGIPYWEPEIDSAFEAIREWLARG